MRITNRFLGAFLLVATCAAAFGDTLVVPNSQTNTPGNLPLKLGSNPIRLQEIVGSGQFNGPIVITGIHLRSAVGTGAVHIIDPSFKMTLSTTQAYPNTKNGHMLPSDTYANNVGPDATTVYNGALSGSSPGCNGPAPCAFDLAIPFTAPFSYDPNQGRLLVDVVASAPSGTPTGSLDAVQFPDSSSSNVALLLGDPTLAAGTLALGGIVLGLDFAAAVGPTVTAVLNGASFDTHVCPGVYASIFGANFGSATAGVSISVGGKPGYVAGVTPSQINAQLPFEAAAGPTSITVTVGGVTSTPFDITLDSYAPGLFTSNGTGSGFGTFLTTAGAKVTPASPVHPGDVLLAFAAGLGPTNPATPTGPPKTVAPTATTPKLTVAGVPLTPTFAGISTFGTGLYQINFTVPAEVQGNVPVVLSIGGKDSKPVTLPVFGISAIVSNASFDSPATAAAGSIVSLFGNGFGATDQQYVFPGTMAQGVSVSFNGRPAPLFTLTATQGQIDLLVPSELSTSGTVDVTVTTPSGTSTVYKLTMAAAAPGLYFIADPSTKNRFNAIAQFNNTAWLAMPASMAAALKYPGNCTASNYNPASFCAQPAAPGDFLILYTTGLGKATPNGDPSGAPLKTGTLPPADGSVLYKTVDTPTVTVGGMPVEVLYSGLAPGFAGLYEIAFQVPHGITGDDVPVAVSISGSPVDMRTIAIQAR